MGFFFSSSPFCSWFRFINIFNDTNVLSMRTQLNLNKNLSETNSIEGKVRVTDLLFRLNEERKIEKKRNLALGVAAVSAVTVFGIILTI
jgi:hypothetical protein